MLSLPAIYLLFAISAKAFLAARHFRLRLRAAASLLVLRFSWDWLVPRPATIFVLRQSASYSD
jgi:hypothetical protein